ncbi:VWA domain-containing protein [Vibrio sp. JC009]|uniref:vWA domain-containing protein n=1 Tax=Vibrio sp. JC009 TaxID=2912314 RepID=UPI0023AF0F30|nr:VWA domain-containing protein [Vibrio sp. JC009]WED24998.1 VWA domain-containing protein [Vibrio sp. JC009]
MLLLLPLPVLVYLFAPPAKESAAIHLPYLPEGGSMSGPSNRLLKVLTLIIWVALVTASARPVLFGEPVESHPKHRDLMLVVDLSGSMNTEDMEHKGDFTDRLSAVKRVLTNFIDKRQGDRLGLILFADHAYLQTPLTLDRQTISAQLNQAVLGLVGKKTAIGEGIGLATKTFVDSDAPQRVMVVLSDGANNAGVLEPLKAAEIAKKYGTTIYTVGVGAGEMQVKEFFFTRTVNTAKDLDEKTLTEVAELSGGKYFRARNQQDLQDIYDTINKLEPVSNITETWRPQSEWFKYPLTIALILSAILVVLRRHHG